MSCGVEAMTIRVGEVCAGIGGFGTACRMAGMEVAWQIEIDSFCNKILAKHFPGVKRYGDLKKVDARELEPVDVLVGGTPCQDVSVAGKRAGLAGGRSGLFYDFVRIAQELKPRFIIFENVPGLLSSCGCAACGAMRRILRVHHYLRQRRKIANECPVCLAARRLIKSHRGRDFAIVLSRLALIGYSVAYRVLNSQYFGVAQRRNRIFLVGHFGEARGASQVLFEPESLHRDTEESREERREVAGTLNGGAHPGGYNGQDAFGGLLQVTGTVGGSQDAGTIPQGSAERSDSEPVRVVGSLAARDYKGADNIYAEEGKQVSLPITTLRTSHTKAHGENVKSDGTSYTLEASTAQGLAVLAPTLNASGSGTERPGGQGAEPGFYVPVDLNSRVSYNGAHGKTGKLDDRTLASQEEFRHKERGLLGVWANQEDGNSPQERELARQSTEESSGDVPELPLSTPQPNQDMSGAKLQSETQEARLLRETQPTLREVRHSPNVQAQPTHTNYAVRRLTVTECEILQSFPVGWTCTCESEPCTSASERHCPDGPRYKALGNAVTVSTVFWIASRINRYIMMEEAYAH